MRPLLLLLSLALAVSAQDASLVLRTSVNYRTQRASRPLTDDQKKEVDRLEALARDANTAKQYGDALRHLYHGLAVINGAPWTPTVEAASAYQAKAAHAIVAPGGELTIQLTTLFTAQGEPLTVSLALRAPQGDDPERVILAPRKLDGAAVSTRLPADLKGEWFVETHLAGPEPPDAKAKGFFTKSTPIRIDDFSADLARLRAKLAAAPTTASAAAVASAEYALALYDRADRGETSPHRVDLHREFTTAQALADSIAAGKDPFAGQRGDFRRAYRSMVDNTLQPYRLFIPPQYDFEKPFPLVVALHGMGGDENSIFDAYGAGVFKREAARLGLIVVCPRGRDTASMYMGDAEKDVLDVLAEVRRDLKIDANRIYLMGHSMGGYGTWSIAMRHPDIWAALGPIAGGGFPGGMAALKSIPEFVVHGDADKTVNVSMSRNMVEAGKKLGAPITYIEVPGGSHNDVVVPNIPAMFDFLAKQAKSK